MASSLSPRGNPRAECPSVTSAHRLILIDALVGLSALGGVLWTEVPVDLLDLDAFDDAGRFRGRPRFTRRVITPLPSPRPVVAIDRERATDEGGDL